jgi:hypothetical protein
VLGGSSILFSDVLFAKGGSQTIRIKATRNGVILSQGSAVVDVVPYTTRGSRWTSTLDVDSDESISPLDVLGVINWLNDTSSNRSYALNFDVDRDNSISPLDVLAIINHINSSAGSTPPTPFSSLTMNDSGSADGLTADVGVRGKVKELNSKLYLALDGSARKQYVDAVSANGQFDLTDSAIAQLFGTAIDGDHLLTIGTIGSDGVWRGMDRRFTKTIRVLSPFELKTALIGSGGGLFLEWSSAGPGVRYRVVRSVAGGLPETLASDLSDVSVRINLSTGDHDIYIEAYNLLGDIERSPTLPVKVG